MSRLVGKPPEREGTLSFAFLVRGLVSYLWLAKMRFASPADTPHSVFDFSCVPRAAVEVAS
jgi:hypothetical protein